MINREISTILLEWFQTHKRPLPWRETYNPYHVWISEIMLQQTQMERGVDYFTRWVAKYPDIKALAAAKDDDVMKLWEGLGYYSRVTNLLKAARIIAECHNNLLPCSEQGLLALPGIGPYTAAAIASIAYNHDVCVIDANVERLISRICDFDQPIKSTAAKKFMHATCMTLLPKGQARNFNQALMEYGSLVCSPQNPSCQTCKLLRHCQAASKGVQLQRPVNVKSKEIIYLSMATGVLIKDGRIFVQKRKSDDLWADLWEFPGGLLESGETPEQALVREYLEETELNITPQEYLGAFKHSYTKYRVTLYAYIVALDHPKQEPILHAAQEYRWNSWAEIQQLAFPAGHRKLIEKLNTNAKFLQKVLP